MKKALTTLLLALLALTVSAQPPHGGGKRFTPEQFTREQETFISKEARLTPQEAAAFFPVFREMQAKQRELFRKQREQARQNPQSEREAEQLINSMDNLDMQIHKLQQQYHSKFCKIIPATKAYLCIKAEEHFKHKVMGDIARHMNQGQNNTRQKKK